MGDYTMKEMGEELYALGLNYIDKAIQPHVRHLRIDFYGIIKESLIEKYNVKKDYLLEICGDLDLTWVKKFLSFPQISNLVIAYLQYILDIKVFKEYASVEKKPEFVIGDITAHALAIINEHYEDKSEQEVVVIKTFLEILAASCSEIRLEEMVVGKEENKDRERKDEN